MNIFKSVFKILILIIFIGTAEFSCFKSKYPEIASFLLSAGILRELRDGTGAGLNSCGSGTGRDGSGTELMREWDGTGLNPCGSGTGRDGNRKFSKFGALIPLSLWALELYIMGNFYKISWILHDRTPSDPVDHLFS